MAVEKIIKKAEKAPKEVNKKNNKVALKNPHGGDDNEPQADVTVAHLAPKLFLNPYHPLLFKVGLRMSAGSITGSTQRCLSMLIAIKQMIHDHVTPENKDFVRSFQAALNSAVKFLNQCRPLSVSMLNGIAFIKLHLTKIPSTVTEEIARKQMKSLVEGFMTKEIELAVKAITKEGAKKIDHDGEVILTYGNPLLVKNILLKAFMDGKNFHVIVVDAKPRMVGKDLMKYLVSRGVKTTYIQINAIAHVMNKVTKVFLGAHAMLANGYAMASIGSAQIALVANSFNVPVLVCCETFKFSEKAILDSFALSKSGPTEDIFNYGSTGKSKTTKGSKSKQDEVQKQEKKVNVLSLSYDLTPPSFITMIITEKSFLPCSSVSAVIRNNSQRTPDFQ